MKSIIKTSKRSIIAILALCILLGIAGTAAMAKETTETVEESAVATEDTAVVTEESTQELVPVMARACGSYIHYSVNGYYGNGYVKSVTVTTYYNGSAIDTYTVNYPQSGADSMSSFAGCKCPMCN